MCVCIIQSILPYFFTYSTDVFPDGEASGRSHSEEAADIQEQCTHNYEIVQVGARQLHHSAQVH